MVMKFWIFEIAVLYALGGFDWLEPIQADNSYAVTTCEEFERGAQFYPNDVVKSLWKIIYFLSNTTETNPIIFSLLDSKRLENFRSIIETVAPELGVEWDKAIFMMEPRPGVQVVFIYGGSAGTFRGVVKMEQRDKERPFPEPLIKLADVRIKQKGDYLGMMCCEVLTAFVMARLDYNVPATEEECLAVAASFGFKDPDGRTYLSLENITHNEL